MKLKILSFIAVVMVAFFANAQAPVIASFSPTVSCAGTGTSITLSIVGSNFTGATAVSIGGLAVNTFNVVNSTHLTAVVSPFANGYISITTPKGTTLSKNVFYVSGRTDYAYIPNPYDSSVSFITVSYTHLTLPTIYSV